MIPNASELSSLTASDCAGRYAPRLFREELWEGALQMLLDSSVIAIVTGFMVPFAKAPETDGPPGSAVLARALERCGKKVAIFTDPFCFNGVLSCAGALGVTEVRSAARGEEILDLEPDLVIFIERLGRTREGLYCNMHGKDISDYTYPLDEAALIASRKKIPVLAVGDGGNEVGMGSVASELSKALPGFSNCLSSVECDLLLPVDVSNWGVYALCAVLSWHVREWLGHSEEEERSMLRAMVEADAVDGVTGEATPSVDGFDLAENMERVKQYYHWFQKSVENDRPLTV